MWFGHIGGYHLLTAEQMRLAEERAVEMTGVTLGELMDRAGAAVAEVVEELFPEGPVVVLAGGGNNGGDGWVAARVLHESGRDVRVLSTRPPSELAGIAAAAANAARGTGVAWSVPAADDAIEIPWDAVVIDALLGTGSSGPLREPLPAWLRATEPAAARIAVDVPTGVNSDTGEATGPADADGPCDPAGWAFDADVTVTFSAPKLGLHLFPGAALAGDVIVADIGIPEALLEPEGAPRLLSEADYLQALPDPAADASKFDRGRLLVVAGSRAYAGAAVLVARGAQRAGAGYIQMAVPDPVRPIVQAAVPAAVTEGLPATPSGTFSAEGLDRLLELAAAADAVVCGPGLSRDEGITAVVEALLGTDRPLLLDADALNALAGRGALVAQRDAPTVITPHAGELARLLAVTAGEVRGDRVSSVVSLSGPQLVVVLKGAASLVSGAGQVIVNPTGSPALATAGTGDVLSGVIGALMAQGVTAFEASALGVYLHGDAGDLAAEALSPLSVTAEDVPDFVALAIARMIEDWMTDNG